MEVLEINNVFESWSIVARKSRDEYTEMLEKQVRELKSTNRQLTKRLRKIDKQFRVSLELEEEEQRKAPKKEKQPPDCPKCLKGYLVSIDLGAKKIVSCTCGYRRTEK